MEKLTRPAHRPTKEPSAATAQMQLRLTPERKAHYVRHAQIRGGISAWAQRVLDDASKYSPPAS